MGRMKRQNALGIILVFLTVVMFVAKPGEVLAKQDVVDVEGISYSVSSSMADNLKSLLGKKVSVTTVTGKDFTGIVKEVGDHLVHLEKIEGKEFFDALIRIENISAIETMFRTYKH